MSTNPSYKIRFRRFVRDLSRRYNDLQITNDSQGDDVFISKMNYTPISRKRTYFDSFELDEFEVERYGQRIDDKFFQNNIGHGVIG